LLLTCLGLQAVERGDNAIPVDEYLRDHVLGGEVRKRASKADGCPEKANG
jgi:hypothetical protein